MTSARRVAQFARDSANFVTPDLLFTSLLRGGSPGSRETVPSSRRLTYYLPHFREAGRAVARGSRGLGAAPELGATTETLTSPNSFRGRVPPPFLLQCPPLVFSAPRGPFACFRSEIRLPLARFATRPGQVPQIAARLVSILRKHGAPARRVAQFA